MLNKIKQIEFNVLLSSWDENKEGLRGKAIIDASIEYLEKIDNAVKGASEGRKQENKMGFCSQIVEKLGLPKAAQNPLVLKSFLSNMR